MNTSTSEVMIAEDMHNYTPEGVGLVLSGYESMRIYHSRSIGRGAYPNNTPLRSVTLIDRYIPPLLNAENLVRFCIAERLVTVSDVTGALWAILENNCKEIGARPVLTVDLEDGQDIATFF